MKKIEQWISNLTKEQKIIVALAFPAGLYCITFPFTQWLYYEYGRRNGLTYSWLVWFVFIVIIAIAEFKIWGQKKDKKQ